MTDKVKVLILPGGIAPKRMTDGANGYDVYIRAVVTEEWDGEIPYMWKTLFDFEHVPEDPEIARHVKKRLNPDTGLRELAYLVRPGELMRIGAGVVLALPFPMGALTLVKSGLSVKRKYGGYVPAHLFDSDFRGELTVPIHNTSKKDIVLFKNMRIAQIVILPFVTPEFTIVERWEDLPPTERGTKGLGSTGTG